MSVIYFLTWCSIHAALGGTTGRWSLDAHLPVLMECYIDGLSPGDAAIVTATLDAAERRAAECSAAGLPL